MPFTKEYFHGDALHTARILRRATFDLAGFPDLDVDCDEDEIPTEVPCTFTVAKSGSRSLGGQDLYMIVQWFPTGQKKAYCLDFRFHEFAPVAETFGTKSID